MIDCDSCLRYKVSAPHTTCPACVLYLRRRLAVEMRKVRQLELEAGR